MISPLQLAYATPYKIQSEIIDVHGYLITAMYIHYFMPGTLKLHTKLYINRLEPFEGMDYSDIDFESSGRRVEGDPLREDGDRWLPMNEMPYPGYCRPPGSSQCLDSLCNCKVLKEKWLKYLEKQKKEN